MKKILYIEANRDGTVGGSYYSLLYLIQRLDKSKYEPHVLFCQEHFLLSEFKKVTPNVYVDNFGPSSSNSVENLADLFKWPYRLLTKVLLKQFTISKIINNIRPDIVHLNNGYSALHEWILACRMNKIKIVAHDRGTRYPCTFQTRLFVRLLDAIISVSESYKENVLKQNLKPRKLRRIYNGLDVEQIENLIDHKASEEFRNYLGLRTGQPVVGIIGNIDKWKGQHVLISAIKQVKKFYPDIKCLIVGKPVLRAGLYMDELQNDVKNSCLEDNVVFTGFRTDVANILNLFDILVHASIEPEPFGRVLLEGMALGKPIIATNAGGPVEIVVDDVTGLLVPMNDPASMANAITTLLGNPAKAIEMGKRGKERLMSTFSTNKTVSEIEKLYEEILG